MSAAAESSSNSLVKIAYFTSLAGISALLGFSVTLGRLRKNEPSNPAAVLHQEGMALARSALLRGTVYSILGFSFFSLTWYKFFGRRMIEDFNQKAKKNSAEDTEYLKNLMGLETSSEGNR